MQIVSRSTINRTCPGLHADCFTESATNITCLGLRADCFEVYHQQNMSRAACRLFRRVCHKQHVQGCMQIVPQSLPQTTCLGLHADCFTESATNIFMAACRLFRRVCHQHNMFGAACRLFHRVCHKHNMFRAASRLFQTYHPHIMSSSMSGTACNSTMLVSQSATKTCLGQHVTARCSFHRVCHQHDVPPGRVQKSAGLYQALRNTCSRTQIHRQP